MCKSKPSTDTQYFYYHTRHCVMFTPVAMPQYRFFQEPSSARTRLPGSCVQRTVSPDSGGGVPGVHRSTIRPAPALTCAHTSGTARWTHLRPLTVALVAFRPLPVPTRVCQFREPSTANIGTETFEDVIKQRHKTLQRCEREAIKCFTTPTTICI